jgi:hypothetical protein
VSSTEVPKKVGSSVWGEEDVSKFQGISEDKRDFRPESLARSEVAK